MARTTMSQNKAGTQSHINAQLNAELHQDISRTSTRGRRPAGRSRKRPTTTKQDVPPDEDNEEGEASEADEEAKSDGEAEPSPPPPPKRTVIKVKSKSAQNNANARKTKANSSEGISDMLESSGVGPTAARKTSKKRKRGSEASPAAETLFDESDYEWEENHDEGGQGHYDDPIEDEDREPTITVESIPTAGVWKAWEMKLYANSLYRDIPECIEQLKKWWEEDEEELVAQTKLLQQLEIHIVWNLAADIIKNDSMQNEEPCNDFTEWVVDLIKKLKALGKRKSWQRKEAALHDFYYMVYPALVLLGYMAISIMSPILKTSEENQTDTLRVIKFIISFIETIAELEHWFIRNLTHGLDEDEVEEYKSLDFVERAKKIAVVTFQETEKSFKRQRDVLEWGIANTQNGTQSRREQTDIDEARLEGKRRKAEAAKRRREEQEQARIRDHNRAMETVRRRRHEAFRNGRSLGAGYGRSRSRMVPDQDLDDQEADEEWQTNWQQLTDRLDELEDTEWEAEWMRLWEMLAEKLESGNTNSVTRAGITAKMDDLHARRLDHYRLEIWQSLQEINGVKYSPNIGRKARIHLSFAHEDLEVYKMTEEEVARELRDLATWLLGDAGLSRPEEGTELEWTKWFISQD